MKNCLFGIIIALGVALGAVMALLPETTPSCGSAYDAGYIVGVNETTRMFREGMR